MAKHANITLRGFYVFVSLSLKFRFVTILTTSQGIMITTVAITSYNLDCYPEGSGEVVRFQILTLCCLKSMLIYGSM